MSAALLRGSVLFGVWLVLAGPDAAGLPFGLAAAALGAWASLSLLPPAPGRLAPVAAARLVGHILREGAAAGWDIALRAFARDSRLTPGLVAIPVALAPGAAQDALRLLASLAPGMLPVAVREDGRLLVHALDTGAPHLADIAAIEVGLRMALGMRDG